MYRIVAVLLVVSVASVALAQSPSPPKKPAATLAGTKSTAPATIAAAKSGPSLCVTSYVGYRFELKTVGLTVFGNALDPVDTTAWGLDDLIVRKVGAIAGNHFAVRRITLSRSTIDSFDARKKSIFESLFRDPRESAKEFLNTLNAAAGSAGKCDFLSRSLQTDQRIWEHQPVSKRDWHS